MCVSVNSQAISVLNLSVQLLYLGEQLSQVAPVGTRAWNALDEEVLPGCLLRHTDQSSLISSGKVWCTRVIDRLKKAVVMICWRRRYKGRRNLRY